MKDEDKYEQKPQNLCKWCSFYVGNGGPCDVQLPKWKPKYKKTTTRKNVKAVNAIIDDDLVDNLPQYEDGEKNTVWPDND